MTTILRMCAAFAASVVVTAALSAQPTAHDPLGYEMILLPVSLPDVVARPGAFGSVWQTTLVLQNANPVAVDVFHAECTYFCTCSVVSQCGPRPTPPQTTRLAGFQAEGPANPGSFVYVQRRYSKDVSLHLRVADISRSALTYGTEIPVVRDRDFFTTTLRLLDVPLDRRFRQHVRIYGIGSPSGGGDVAVRIVPLESNTPLVEERVAIQPPAPWSFLQRVDQFPEYPGYAEIGPQLLDRYPQLAGVDRVRIEITPITPELVFWAFASITNNETQQVTTISPN